MRSIIVIMTLSSCFNWTLAQAPDDSLEIKSFYDSKAKALLSQTVNAYELTSTKNQAALKALSNWEMISDSLGILPKYRLPTSLLCFTDSSWEYNLIPGYTNICYTPNVDLVYQIVYSLHKVRLELAGELSFLGINSSGLPSPATILAVLSKETWMMADTAGDKGQAIGMCQLHSNTALFITSDQYRYHDIFRRFIETHQKTSLEDPGFCFKGVTAKERQQSMLDFFVRFMVICKKYNPENPEDGIRCYNGSGLRARNYAIDVLKRIAAYDVFLARSPLFVGSDIKELQSDPKYIWFISPNSGDNSGVLSDSEQLLYYEAAKREFEESWSNMALFKGIDGQNRFVRFDGARSSSDSSRLYYICFDTKRTLFSYFRGELWEAVKYHNSNSSKKIELFYYQDGVLQTIGSDKDFKEANGQAFYKNLRSKQKIYVRPNSWIYMYDAKGRSQKITIYLETSS